MSLASLAAQSHNLIRAAAGILPDAHTLPGAEAPIVLPDDEAAAREPSTPKYSTANTLEYYVVRDALIANVWGGEVQGQSTVVSDYINTWVETRMDEGQYGGFPNADELLNDPEFQNGAWATRFRAAGAPSSFIYTDEEGSQFWVSTVGNTPGITPLAEAIEDRNRGPVSAGVAAKAGDVGGIPKAAFENRAPEDSPVPEGIAAKQGNVGGIPAAAGVQQFGIPKFMAGAPTLDTSQLGTLLSPKPTGGGGGGGGGGRAGLEFDQAALEEAARNQWRRWLLEDPDPDKLRKVVGKYQSAANAFWVGKGGRLDFDVFVKDEIRETPRYATVFKWRPPAVAEDEFLDQYRQIEGLGLRSDVAQNQIMQSVTSGGSAADQTVRVSRTREASALAGSGRRLANTIQSLGRLG